MENITDKKFQTVLINNFTNINNTNNRHWGRFQHIFVCFLLINIYIVFRLVYFSLLRSIFLLINRIHKSQ